jgi:hypothetical protein
MKFLKILTILSAVLFILTAIAVILEWIKLINAISPLIFGISFLAMTTSLNLVKQEQNKIKWVSLSLAVIGFLILSLSTFKILEMKDFWYLGVVPLSISILLGLFYQIQLVTNLKGRFFIFGRLLTSFICGFLILVGLQIDNPKIYLTGKVVLTIFTIYILIGSLLKPKTIK